MSEIYALTLEKEVLRELAASINASYNRYFIKYNIDSDSTHPLIANNYEVITAKRAILRCNTFGELEVYERRLKELREIINALEDADQCKKKNWKNSQSTNSTRHSREYTKI